MRSPDDGERWLTDHSSQGSWEERTNNHYYSQLRIDATRGLTTEAQRTQLTPNCKPL